MRRFFIIHIILFIIYNVGVAANPVHVIITAGQSNTDGRVKNIKLPLYIKELAIDKNNYVDGAYKFCKISQNRSDGKFIPFWPNCTRLPETNKWAYDAEVNAGMRKLAEEDKNINLIDMSDGELQDDKLHFTEKSAEYLGKQMYNVLLDILKDKSPLYSTYLENLSRGGYMGFRRSERITYLLYNY